jgi:hypothetical protein
LRFYQEAGLLISSCYRAADQATACLLSLLFAVFYQAITGMAGCPIALN